MSAYFSFVNISHPKNKNMIICKALLKYDYKPFSLMVVEYCSISKLQEREQYWIDTLNPNYNVLKYAFSFQGYKHTPESLRLISQSAVLKVHTESTNSRGRFASPGLSEGGRFAPPKTKESISQSMKGERNPFF